ncbi:MAG: single-stranded DNA-binding protein [Candidatus Njordarchaeales archaeon]
MSSLPDFTKIKELRVGSKGINVRVRILELFEPRSVFSRHTGERHTVREALVGDDTGVILLTLWNDDINKVEIGKTYDLLNVNTSVFRNSLRLGVGRKGKIIESENEISAEEVNTENNVSEKVVSAPRKRWY